MSNLAEKFHEEPGYLDRGVVVSARAGDYTLEVGGRRVEAERAAMCLLEPRVGDQVLVAAVRDDHFLLGVLRRAESDAAARLSVPDGDVELVAQRGSVRVAAQRGFDVTTAGDVAFTSRRLRLHAVEAEAVFEKLRVLGDVLHAEARKVVWAAEKVESVCERVWARVKRSYRFVEETDQLRAGNIDHRARGIARWHADNAVLTANHLAKIDGEQIHVG